MYQTAKHDMRHDIKLVAYRFANVRMVVAMAGCPPGRDTINQFASVGQLDAHTLRGDSNQRRWRGGHLSIGQPNAIKRGIKRGKGFFSEHAGNQSRDIAMSVYQRVLRSCKQQEGEAQEHAGILSLCCDRFAPSARWMIHLLFFNASTPLINQLTNEKREAHEASATSASLKRTLEPG